MLGKGRRRLEANSEEGAQCHAKEAETAAAAAEGAGVQALAAVAAESPEGVEGAEALGRERAGVAALGASPLPRTPSPGGEATASGLAAVRDWAVGGCGSGCGVRVSGGDSRAMWPASCRRPR
jgi:hypothetical protein